MPTPTTDKFVLTAYNTRSETYYTFGPMTERSMAKYTRLLRLAHPGRWEFGESNVRLLNHPDSAFTGLASNVEWAFDSTPDPSPNTPK